MKESSKNRLFYGVVFLVCLLVIFTLYSFISSLNPGASSSITGNVILERPDKMKEFDIQLAKSLMDANNDGKCDYCGMDVDLCIDSGMLECTMNPEAKIGLLDSAHVHAYFKVYLGGEIVDFNEKRYFVKSAFAHVEPEKNEEETGSVLHIHAKGVPLRLFFESLGMRFDSSCFKLESEEEFCNNEDNKLRFFVNGAENSQFGDYVPENLDKILISYGSGDEINTQLNSVTDYAKNN